MRGFAQFLLVLLNLLVVASVSHEHSTRLYRASRVGGTSTKRMDPAKKMRVDDITIVDVELPAEEDDGVPLRLLAGHQADVNAVRVHHNGAYLSLAPY